MIVGVWVVESRMVHRWEVPLFPRLVWVFDVLLAEERR